MRTRLARCDESWARSDLRRRPWSLTLWIERELNHGKSAADHREPRGIGRKLAEAVLAAGEQLVATARDPESLRELVAAYPDHALTVALDVKSAASARDAVAAAVARFGRLDVVVNNAGYANISSVEAAPEQGS